MIYGVGPHPGLRRVAGGGVARGGNCTATHPTGRGALRTTPTSPNTLPRRRVASSSSSSGASPAESLAPTRAPAAARFHSCGEPPSGPEAAAGGEARPLLRRHSQ